MRRKCRERFPHHQLQREPLVSDPGMHHGMCVTHVPWYMSGSLNRGGGENVPGIPSACTTCDFTYLARSPRVHEICNSDLQRAPTTVCCVITKSVDVVPTVLCGMTPAKRVHVSLTSNCARSRHPFYVTSFGIRKRIGNYCWWNWKSDYMINTVPADGLALTLNARGPNHSGSTYSISWGSGVLEKNKSLLETWK